MGFDCEMVSEFMCTSELYKSKSSVVFLKQMLICRPKITVSRHPSHTDIPRLSSKFPPTEPSERDPAFFPHRYTPNTKISPNAQRLSSPAYSSSSSFPVHLPSGRRLSGHCLQAFEQNTSWFLLYP